jgi:hypothetical protein
MVGLGWSGGYVDFLLAGCLRGCEIRFRWKECGVRGGGWG